ncbi:hypothetical protein BBW65_01200 [Helicobacter enhydrae]|uniref:GmrSD restriction endonucleases N-terminal domain-containing protein n=1 Tax=Helicobacter enhydrae TaxID=222136 RepID=A0A1B1U446_9HELI|nr:DUF262 domain-containing protein [Helicobacter enhydrae]ANV97511.1 hypothetical protein BBW65_01200 [Helicobacter enhydrae]
MKNKKYTLKTWLDDLLKKECQVRIPPLQRDYAQGRTSQKHIAQSFLNAIFEVLKGNGKLHIDFIYGYQKDNGFYLIDGQQRMTTLWLLHLLLYKKDKNDKENQIDHNEWLKNFSYSVRESSSLFCKNLLEKDFDTGSKSISEAIRAKGSEFVEAEDLHNDATIKAMLNMLDWINEKIKKCDKDIEVLIDNLENITFSVFDMGEFALGEELYIKMNARGKQLSKYENLKAFFEKDISDIALLGRIDTQWSDYFFDSKKPETFDIRGRNFLHYATLFFCLENLQDDKEQILKDWISKPNRPVEEKYYAPLKECGNIQLLDNLIALCESFKDNKKMDLLLKPKTSSFFDGQNGLNEVEICYFISLLCYVEKIKSVDGVIEDNLIDYLRVSRHFIENRPSATPNIKLLYKLFKHLSSSVNTTNIYGVLKKPESAYTFEDDKKFYKKIYDNEVRKAELIVESRKGENDWESILDKTSDHPSLIGRVKFLIDFADEKAKEYADKANKKLEIFKQYAEITMLILSKDFLENNLPLFQRALLSIEDYGFCKSSNSFYGSCKHLNYEDRQDWHWILSGNYGGKRKPTEAFKILLEKLSNYINGQNFTIDKIKLGLEAIIKGCVLSEKSWWEQLMISEEEMFKFIASGRIKFITYDREGEWYYYRIELLMGARKRVENLKKIRDLLNYAFYHFCKKVCGENSISGYKYSEKSGKPHFTLKGENVVCDIENNTIEIGNKKFELEYNNLFKEFKEILLEKFQDEINTNTINRNYEEYYSKHLTLS